MLILQTIGFLDAYLKSGKISNQISFRSNISAYLNGLFSDSPPSIFFVLKGIVLIIYIFWGKSIIHVNSSNNCNVVHDSSRKFFCTLATDCEVTANMFTFK